MASANDKKHAKEYCVLNEKISSVKKKYSERRQNKNAHKNLLLDQIRSAVQDLNLQCIPIVITDEYGEERTLYVRRQKQTTTATLDEHHILEAISRVTLDQLREVREELSQKRKFKDNPPTVLQIWVMAIYQNIRSQICTSREKIVLSETKPRGFKKSKLNPEAQALVDQYVAQLEQPARDIYSIDRDLDTIRQQQADECDGLEDRIRRCERSVDNVMRFAAPDPDKPNLKTQPVMRSHTRNEHGQPVAVVHTLVSETKTVNKKIGLKATERKLTEVLAPIFEDSTTLGDSFARIGQVHSFGSKIFRDLKREHTETRTIHKVARRTD